MNWLRRGRAADDAAPSHDAASPDGSDASRGSAPSDGSDAWHGSAASDGTDAWHGSAATRATPATSATGSSAPAHPGTGSSAPAHPAPANRGGPWRDGAAGRDPHEPPRRLMYATALGLAGIWLVLDQATKVLAVRGLADQPVGLGPLDLTVVHNEGGAFGLDPGLFPGLFIVVTVAVVLLIARALPRTDRLSLAAAYGLIGGGALGNLVDRLFRGDGFPRGAVVDFIDLGWWPVFNLADIGIVVGAVVLALLLIKVDRQERAAEPKPTESGAAGPGAAGPGAAQPGTADESHGRRAAKRQARAAKREAKQAAKREKKGESAQPADQTAGPFASPGAARTSDGRAPASREEPTASRS